MLYGDMNGGLAVISDVPKTMVYQLARYINRNKAVIPHPVLKREPSAELKPGQVDRETLPPYDVLDHILHMYIEEDRSPGDIQLKDVPPSVTRWVIESVNNNEYKRRQAPPGLKVTGKAFGVGRRMPMAARYTYDDIDGGE